MAAGTGVATVTGTTGPGKSATSLSLAAVTSIFFDVTNRVVRIKYGNNATFELDYGGTVTVTDTISGVTSTFVFST